jgi:hypothetical protein
MKPHRKPKQASTLDDPTLVDYLYFRKENALANNVAYFV